MPDLERIQQATPGTLSQQWYEDGAAVDPGTVTVGITRADGTVLVAAGTPTAGTGTAARTYNLTTTHTALLDRLTVTWTSALKGTLASYVEVVGGFLFSIVEARAVAPLQNTTTYTTASIVAMRTLVEQALEDACGVAFVPRYELEVLNGEGSTTLTPMWPRIRAIRSVTANTVAFTGAQLASVVPYGSALYYPSVWTAGFGNIVIGYEHGYDSPPERVREAAMREARYRLVQRNSPTDERATSFSNDQGTWPLVVPGGRGGNGFWLPDTNEVVRQYGMTVGVA